ncbi:hypothetical protein ACHAWF_003072, partial [Thalassiosira exigua]
GGGAIAVTESLAKLERIAAKLKQTAEWRTSSHGSTNKSVPRSSSFGKTESMTPWSKDQLRRANRGGDGKVSRTEPLTVYEEVLDDVREGGNRVALPVPDYACQSYAGKLIQIQHYVSIAVRTPSCLTSPKIHIPVEIVPPRNTPIVTAQAISLPSPSAPPLLPDDLDADHVFASACAEGVPVLNDGEVSFPGFEGVGEREALVKTEEVVSMNEHRTSSGVSDSTT